LLYRPEEFDEEQHPSGGGIRSTKVGNGEEREVENGEDRQGYRKRYEYDKSNITYYYLQTFLEVGSFRMQR